jgi:hypothetical protein
LWVEIWGGLQAETYCTLCTSFMHLARGLEGVLLLVVRIYPQDLNPLPIVEIALSIGKRAFEEFVDLRAKPQSHENEDSRFHEHL